MSTKSFDILVLGAGNSFDVIREAGAAGKSIAVIEKGPLGGTCPNRGCIPSKLVLAHADVAHAIRTADRFHIDARIESIDADAILRETREYVERFDGLLEDALPESVTLFRGHGRFTGNHTVEVGGETLEAPVIVVATGTRPRRLDLGVPYWTSDDVFFADRAPESIAIVGGGFVACELAHFFHGVGIRTHVLVRDDQLVKGEDEDTRVRFQEAFTKRVDVRFGTEIARAEHGDGGYRLALTNGDVLETEALLLAAGRVPNTDDLGLDTTDLEVDGRGFLPVDRHLRTGVEGVYALGDVNGRHAFTHAASAEAKHVAALILGETDDPIDDTPMPHAVFTEPELAGLGRTEDELKEDGVAYAAASAPYDSATKGRAIKEEHGLVKLLVGRDGAILGAHIVGAHASILLHEVIPVVRWRNHISSLTDLIHVHPSLPEIVRGAARKAKTAWEEKFGSE